MSRFCDYIVTINKEDYNRAKTFHAPNVRYIPGVGVDIHKISKIVVNKQAYKESIGVPRNCVLLLSVGEMIERKNHEVVIRALSKLQNPNIYYAICGKGPLREHLEKIAKELDVSDRVKFLGFEKTYLSFVIQLILVHFHRALRGLALLVLKLWQQVFHSYQAMFMVYWTML